MAAATASRRPMLFEPLQIFLLVALGLIALLLAGYRLEPPSSKRPPPPGRVLLTVAGAVSRANRGPLAPERDALLSKTGVSFARAVEYDEAALRALVKPAGGESAPPGPRLDDILADAGAKFALIHAYGLGGAASFSAEQLSSGEWTLALSRDGRPLAMGGRGPLVLAHRPALPAGGLGPPEDKLWGLFYIEVKP